MIPEIILNNEIFLNIFQNFACRVTKNQKEQIFRFCKNENNESKAIIFAYDWDNFLLDKNWLTRNLQLMIDIELNKFLKAKDALRTNNTMKNEKSTEKWASVKSMYTKQTFDKSPIETIWMGS